MPRRYVHMMYNYSRDTRWAEMGRAWVPHKTRKSADNLCYVRHLQIGKIRWPREDLRSCTCNLLSIYVDRTA